MQCSTKVSNTEAAPKPSAGNRRLSHIVVDWASQLGMLQPGSAGDAVGMWGFEIDGLIRAHSWQHLRVAITIARCGQQVMCRPKGKLRAIVHGSLQRVSGIGRSG